MTLKFLLPIAALTAGLALAGGAHAQVISKVVNICEVSGGTVNTVELRFFTHDSHLEYRFQTQPSGPNLVFPGTAFQVGLSRKFSVPAGTYKVSFKNPASPAVGVYGPLVVVPPFRISGQTCVVLRPSDATKKTPAAS